VSMEHHLEARHAEVAQLSVVQQEILCFQALHFKIYSRESRIRMLCLKGTGSPDGFVVW
jgi:hypothetical protein